MKYEIVNLYNNKDNFTVDIIDCPPGANESVKLGAEKKISHDQENADHSQEEEKVWEEDDDILERLEEEYYYQRQWA